MNESDESIAIRALLLAAATAWSAGDLEGYLTCYEDAPTTTYVSAAGVVRGLAAIRAMYTARLAAPHAPPPHPLGTLTLADLDIRLLGPDHGLAIGVYHLARDTAQGGAASGRFSLALRKGAGGWRIILDHTS